MVSHRAINDTMQTPKKEAHFFFFSVCCIAFNCSWQLIMFDKKQKKLCKMYSLSNWWWFIRPKSFLHISFAYHSYLIRMSIVCTRMSHVCYFVCHSYVSASILSVCLSCVFVCNGMSLVCTRMSFACLSYVLIYHLVYTRMLFVCHSHAIRMWLVYTRASSVCHSYVLVRHPYVTGMYSYVICMSLVCDSTMNHFTIYLI